MRDKIYFEPDFHQLNRHLKRGGNNNDSSQAEKLFTRLFSRVKQGGNFIYEPEILQKLSDLISSIKARIDWGQELAGATYVAFDTETTGLHPYRGDEITSIGAVIVENKTILNEPYFYQLVNPGRPITPQAQKITGITDEMVREKPPFIPVLIEFLQFCGPRILIAHNAPFDLAFINNKIAETTGRRLVNPVIDTVLLTSALYFSIGDFSLENLSAHFNFSLEGRHNALGDAKIAANLFLKLLPELESKGINTLHDLAGLFADVDLTKGYPLIF